MRVGERRAVLDIEVAGVEDAPELLGLQKLAYQSEAELYQDPGLPPLVETLEELQAEFQTKTVLCVREGGRLVGSVRGAIQDGVGLVERLITHPDHQGRGIGSALLAELEGRWTDARRLRLFTGHRSARNLSFYKKRGYCEFKREPIDEKLTFVWMEKER
jgi:GNAT superfamily N-acetyltransferase